VKLIGKALGFDPVSDATSAEHFGYNGVRVIDHFFSGIPPERPAAVPHAFVTLASVAAITKKVTLTQTVMAATMRHPFELAQGVSCLDRISNGRAELGLGAGWLVAEHEKNGLALGSPGERVSRLAEVASICRQLFVNSGCIEFSGKFFKVYSDAPWPSTPHVPEIMVGAHGLRLIEKVSPYIDRIDLLESMVDGRPCFVGVHSNDIKNLRNKIEVHYSRAERKTKVSATINLKVIEDNRSLEIAQTELASAANCNVSDIKRDHLRIIENETKVFEKLEALDGIGIDRLHIRPNDEYTKEWLNESVLKIQKI